MICPHCKKFILEQNIKLENTPNKQNDIFKCPKCGEKIKQKPINWIKPLIIFAIVFYIAPLFLNALLSMLFIFLYRD